LAGSRSDDVRHASPRNASGRAGRMRLGASSRHPTWALDWAGLGRSRICGSGIAPVAAKRPDSTLA